MYGIIARLSDFGFSIDTSSTEGFAKLIGWTPIWAAPEAGEIIMTSNLHLTDIYSTGFIIQSIITNGRSLFDNLQNLPDEPQLRLEAFQALKRTDEILDFSIAQLLTSEEDEDIVITEVCSFLSSTLQLDPQKRSLEITLRTLRGRYPRHNENETTPKLGFQALKPFDIGQVLLLFRLVCFLLVNPRRQILITTYSKNPGHLPLFRHNYIRSLNPWHLCIQGGKPKTPQVHLIHRSHGDSLCDLVEGGPRGICARTILLERFWR